MKRKFNHISSNEQGSNNINIRDHLPENSFGSSKRTKNFSNNFSSEKSSGSIEKNSDLGNNQGEKLVEAKEKALNGIQSNPTASGTNEERVNEVIHELDKGSGQLSYKLANIKQYLAKHNVLCEKADKAADGELYQGVEGIYRDFARATHAKAQRCSYDLVESIKDIINNTTDLNDIALTPDTTDVCLYLLNNMTWLLV